MANNKKRKKRRKIKKGILKKLIIIICILIVLPILLHNINNAKTIKKNTITYNKNKSFIKSQTVKGITFKDIKCSYNGKNSLISFTLINNTDKTINLKNYKILVKDKKGTILTNIFINFSKELKPKQEKTNKSLVVDVDLSNAYTMELKLNTNNQE